MWRVCDVGAATRSLARAIWGGYIWYLVVELHSLKILRLESGVFVIFYDGGVNIGKLGTWDLMIALDLNAGGHRKR